MFQDAVTNFPPKYVSCMVGGIPQGHDKEISKFYDYQDTVEVQKSLIFEAQKTPKKTSKQKNPKQTNKQTNKKKRTLCQEK